jgi:glycine oxidase
MHRDAVIVGGGIMGCAVALRLAGRGLRPLVLERSVPGAEASSAAAGILAPQQEAEGPGPMLELGLESRARFPSLVRELEAATGVEVGYRRSGLVALAADGDALARLEARAAWQAGRGLRVERLGAAEVRRLEPALAPAAGALLFPDEAQVEPPRLMRALQLAAARAGAEFATAYVRRVLHDGARVAGVEVEGERIASARVVVAAGSWSGLVDGAALPPLAVRPMRGQLVELETRPPLFTHVVFGDGGYLVPRADGRVVVGSTMELVGFRKEVTAAGLEGLLALARRTVPALAEAPVGGFRANFRPFTDDHLPFLGATPIAGLLLATGHFRNGILLVPVTADAVAAVACGEPPCVDLAPFSVIRSLSLAH